VAQATASLSSRAEYGPERIRSLTTDRIARIRFRLTDADGAETTVTRFFRFSRTSADEERSSSRGLRATAASTRGASYQVGMNGTIAIPAFTARLPSHALA
jgi:hypothetical protein